MRMNLKMLTELIPGLSDWQLKVPWPLKATKATTYAEVRKICNRRPLVGAVGAYKRGDARRKDSDLCFAHSRVLRTFTCAPHIHLCHIHLCFAHSLVLRTFTGAFSLEARFLVSVRISLFFVVIMGRSANPIRWLVKLKWKFFGNKTTKKVPKKCPFQLKMSKNIVCSPWWRLMTLSTEKGLNFGPFQFSKAIAIAANTSPFCCLKKSILYYCCMK